MANKVVKFGVNQIQNPTPKTLKYIFRAYTFLAGLWAILAPNFDWVPASTMDEINKWLLIGVPVIHYTIKFFGLDYQED